MNLLIKLKTNLNKMADNSQLAAEIVANQKEAERLNALIAEQEKQNILLSVDGITKEKQL